MKILALFLGLLGYILMVNNTHLFDLQNLYKRDAYQFAQAAISIGACLGFIGIQKLLKSPTSLSYFRGLSLTHVAVFLLVTTLSLALLSLDLDFVFLFVTVLTFAIIEQYIVFAQIAPFYGKKKFLFVFVMVYLLFIFGHGLKFDIPIVVSTLFLMPTLFRTIVDRNIWHGVIFHYTYNVAVVSGLDRPEIDDSTLLTWFLLMLFYWVLLVFTADNAKPDAAKMLSWVFRGAFGRRMAAFLTVLCRLPVLLLAGKRPREEFLRTKDSLAGQAKARALKKTRLV